MSLLIDPHSLRSALKDSLSGPLLSPPAEKSGYLRALVEQRGEVEFSQISSEVGSEFLQRDLAQLNIPQAEHSLKWVLGYGSFLGEFAAAPLVPDFDTQYRASLIGARVNLIVSLYDSYLDQGLCAEEILGDDFSAGSKIELVAALVRSYFRLLKNPIPLLNKAIQTMYRAEKISTSGDFNQLVWRRKSALPLVVMGLSLCDQKTQSASHYSSYLAWLYRAGCCLGWVDDASDIERDYAAGRKNRFVEHGAVEYSADLTRRVMEWMDRHSASPESRHVFLYCVHSWITPRKS